MNGKLQNQLLHTDISREAEIPGIASRLQSRAKELSQLIQELETRLVGVSAPTVPTPEKTVSEAPRVMVTPIGQSLDETLSSLRNTIYLVENITRRLEV